MTERPWQLECGLCSVAACNNLKADVVAATIVARMTVPLISVGISSGDGASYAFW